MGSKGRWGFGLFIIAVVLAGSIFLFVPKYPQFYNHQIVLFCIGLIFFVTTLLIGHLSYPRVHNFKIYLLGYLSGLIGICYLLNYLQLKANLLPSLSKGFLGGTVLIAFLNCLISVTVPSYIKYRNVRSITLCIVAVEFTLIVVGRFIFASTEWMNEVYFDSIRDISFWVGPLCFLCILILSLISAKDDLLIGGFISGLALLYCLLWIKGVSAKGSDDIVFVIFSSIPIYVSIGIMTHWLFKLDQRVVIDPLLQIYNREYCSKVLSEQSNIDVVPPFIIAMVDIDHFKNVNDTYGHQAGDIILYNVAQAVNKGAFPKGITCRYGGEEIAVFFSKSTLKEVNKIMEKIRIEVESITTKFGSKKIKVTISCGIAQRDTIDQSMQQVLAAADKALYRAKEGGRNQVKSAKTLAAPKKQ